MESQTGSAGAEPLCAGSGFGASNLHILRRALSEAIAGFVVGIKNKNGILIELEELSINDNGSLTCYVRSEDDYYYVSDRVTRDYHPEAVSWIPNILLKSKSGTQTRFEDFLVRFKSEI